MTGDTRNNSSCCYFWNFRFAPLKFLFFNFIRTKRSELASTKELHVRPQLMPDLARFNEKEVRFLGASANFSTRRKNLGFD